MSMYEMTSTVIYLIALYLLTKAYQKSVKSHMEIEISLDQIESKLDSILHERSKQHA